mmetsp:Transcript_26336/g.73993  ORF Transcript_26336/g.73993 Transcript_26336/m.73993 type:complete len:205 (-) Transcript_26336:386-1000(-)
MPGCPFFDGDIGGRPDVSIFDLSSPRPLGALHVLRSADSPSFDTKEFWKRGGSVMPVVGDGSAVIMGRSTGESRSAWFGPGPSDGGMEMPPEREYGLPKAFRAALGVDTCREAGTALTRSGLEISVTFSTRGEEAGGGIRLLARAGAAASSALGGALSLGGVAWRGVSAVSTAGGSLPAETGGRWGSSTFMAADPAAATAGGAI